MAKIRLPSKKSIEELYHNKGRDALIWYTWRDALRTLSVVCDPPLNEIWRKDTILYLYTMCLPSLILAQWPNYSKSNTETSYFKSAIYRVNTTTKTAHNLINSYLTSNADILKYGSNNEELVDKVSEAYNTFNSISRIIKASTYAVSDDDSNFADSAIFYASLLQNLKDNNFKKFNAVDYDNIEAQLIDYKLLLQERNINSAWWYNQPLWPINGRIEPRTSILPIDAALRESGLDFLADDLKCLYENKPLGVHAKNYLKKYSVVDINDPISLRRLILGETETENIHAVRALLLGPGGAGKSSLADRLQDKPINQVKKLTVGVDYLNHQPIKLYTVGN